MKALVLSADWRPKDGLEVTTVQEEDRLGPGNVVWHNPTIRVGERPAPVISNAHEVLIRNRACGICGSDIHMFRPDPDGYLDLPAKARAPIAIGHEYSGEVIAVGSAVTRVSPGDPVAVEAQVNCGNCRSCLRGLASNCEFIIDRGYALDGGMATMSVAHERHCWPLAAVVERHGAAKAYDVGALIEPASVVYNGIVNRAGGFRPDDTVAVFGCGPIGLAAVGLAGALGAGRVLAVEPSALKRRVAEQLGASASLDPTSTDAAPWLLEETAGVGIDMAIDATGLGQIILPSVLPALAVGAKIVSIGANMQPVTLDTLQLMFRSASVHFTLGHLGGGFPAVIALHAADRLDLTPMITARFPLDDGVAALQRASEGQDAKVLVLPGTD